MAFRVSCVRCSCSVAVPAEILDCICGFMRSLRYHYVVRPLAISVLVVGLTARSGRARMLEIAVSDGVEDVWGVRVADQCSESAE